MYIDLPPAAVYAPNNCAVNVVAVTDCAIAIAHAPGFGTYPARVIAPEEIRRSVRGEGTNQRFVTDILPADKQAKQPARRRGHHPVQPFIKLPHNDTDNLPVESNLEEAYYTRSILPRGCVFQRVLHR